LKGLIVALNNQEVFGHKTTQKIVVKFLLKPSKTPKNASVSQVGSGSGGKGLKEGTMPF
jgi:hypothetical protein